MKQVVSSHYDSSLNSGSRNLISLSPKGPFQGNQKSLSFNFNSPKNVTVPTQTKTFFSPKVNTDNVRSSQQLQHSESYLTRKNSKTNQDRANGDTSSSNGITTNHISLNPSKSAKMEIKRYSVDRSSIVNNNDNSKRGPSSESKRLVSQSMNLKENLNQHHFGSSDALNRQAKKLEINTELASSSSAVKLANKSLTTKHKETKELSDTTNENTVRNNVVSSHSFKFMSKFSVNSKGTDSTNGDPSLSTGDNQTDNTPTLDTDKSRKGQEPKKQITILNKFFTQGEKNNLQRSMNEEHLGAALADVKRSMQLTHEKKDSRSGITIDNKSSKKSLSKTQVDLKVNLRSSVNDENKPSSLNTNVESKQESVRKEEKSVPSQKISLSSFITKVGKGEDVIGKATAHNDGASQRESSAKKKEPTDSKVIKAVLTPNSKTSKSTQSLDTKVLFLSGNKSAVQNTETSSTTTVVAKKPSSQISIKLKHSFKESDTNSTTPPPAASIKHTPFVYYMTSMEKSHRMLNDNDYFLNIYREHFIQTFQAMTFCKFLKPVDSKVLNQKRQILNKRESHKDKKTLVFDLDETLIHCNESTDLPCDVKLPIRFPGGECVEAGINIRPFAAEILKELSQHFEIIVFTASHGCYANVVLDHLDPRQQYIHHRLFREACVTTEEGIYIKDLRVINRNLQDMVIVDNAAYSFGYQIENGIPIIPFYDNKLDEELRHLIPYLKFLSGVKDLRDINKHTFKLGNYSSYDSPDKVLDKIIFAKNA
jgi:CTD small phosphatase-like protein 2